MTEYYSKAHSAELRMELESAARELAVLSDIIVDMALDNRLPDATLRARYNSAAAKKRAAAAAYLAALRLPLPPREYVGGGRDMSVPDDGLEHAVYTSQNHPLS